MRRALVIGMLAARRRGGAAGRGAAGVGRRAARHDDGRRPRAVVRDARRVRAAKRRVKSGGRRCTVGAGTPLAALAALRVPIRVRDYGSCGAGRVTPAACS